MIDWRSTMKQTYEFYTVDPLTWANDRLLDTIETCTIDRDSSTATLGSAKINTAELFDECYIRVYLVATQNGNTDKIPLGTFLMQTPSIGFNGMVNNISIDAYTPLIELKEVPTPIGYSLLEGENIMEAAYRICRENVRAPISKPISDEKLYSDFISNVDDTWLTFLTDLISNAKFKFALDEMGRILFEPVQDTASLQPVWIYDDDDSSILYPETTNKRDLYGIPNVVEVVYSNNSSYMYSRVENNDKESPVSIVNRGREIVYRDTNPSFSGTPSQDQIDEYAVQLLRNLSCLEHTITYKHGYCPVRVGDAVILNYTRAGLHNVKATVISQSIKCETGCPVEETAVYTTKLWR